MRSLVIECNILEGSIPHGVGSMTDLEYLSLAVQWLTGDLPGHLGSLANLYALDLHDNILRGYFHDWRWLLSMEEMEGLFLHTNGFSGSIPDWFWSNLSVYLHDGI